MKTKNHKSERNLRAEKNVSERRINNKNHAKNQ